MAGTFLTETDLAPWGLKLTQDTPERGLKAWTTEGMKGKVQRVVDIRWIFDTAEEAQRYHLENLGENSEGAKPIKISGFRKFGQELRVFFKGGDDPMLASLGMQMNMYYFLFCEGNILAKVFVSGSAELQVHEAAKIAQAADVIIKEMV